MPTYQYQCKSCGGDLEVVQKFSDASLTVCPECSGELRKVFNAVGVVFKGSGFYKTDSRSSGSTKKKEPATAAAAPKSEAKASAPAKVEKVA
ncbi:MAG TPA: zinc ribbon domain-containing protein [Arachnia sp.]|jgi:putative FmdB family regulatory protein|nr:zinc ribbon domain-containing protein [Arachnia sp.]